ncbi:hypothetical protein [Haladaptatus sp. W1]|nr:hypothetical protein [Haladaptatus sp. W1]
MNPATPTARLGHHFHVVPPEDRNAYSWAEPRGRTGLFAGDV